MVPSVPFLVGLITWIFFIKSYSPYFCSLPVHKEITVSNIFNGLFSGIKKKSFTNFSSFLLLFSCSVLSISIFTILFFSDISFSPGIKKLIPSFTLWLYKIILLFAACLKILFKVIVVNFLDEIISFNTFPRSYRW